MLLVTEETAPHIVALISLDDSVLEKFLSFTSEKLRKGEYWDIKSKKEIQTKVSQDFQKIIGASIALYNIARFSRKDEDMELFISELKDNNFGDADVERIKLIISRMDELGLKDLINDYVERKSIESLVLPRLANILLTSNYRIVSLSKGQKELVPIVQCAISMTYTDTGKMEQSAFQFTPGELDRIIQNFQDFRTNMQKDTESASSIFSARDV